MNFESQIEKIAKDIRDREDNAMAMEFTKCIAELLKKNGVAPKITEYINENVKENSIEHRYGVTIDELDFSEHDKRFRDEIRQLKHELDKTYNQLMEVEKEAQERIAELESELEVKDNLLKIKNGLNDSIDSETDRIIKLPFDALETANMLINATYKAEIPFLERQVDRNVYDIDDLEQIAEHLLVYCKHNRDDEE